MKNYYNEKQSDYYNLWVSKYYNYEDDVDSFIKVAKGKNILEIGIGTGFFAHLLTKKGFVVEGIEPSDYMISVLKKNYPDLIYYKQGIEELSLSKKYDMVVSHGAFPLISVRKGVPFFDCFLSDKQNIKAFLNVRRVLKKGGLFLANVQSDKQENVIIPKVYKNEIVFEGNLSKKTHYFWNGKDWQVTQTIVSVVYSEDEFENIFKSVGFKVIGFSEDKKWWLAEAV